MSSSIIQNKLQELGLKGMARALEMQLQLPEQQRLGFEQRLGMLIDAEVSDRDTRKTERHLKGARLRFANAVMEDINYRRDRKLDQQLIKSLADCAWIQRRQNIIVTGATGTGKSYIACAFGAQACRQGLLTHYTTATQLFEQLALAKADGSLPKLRRQLVKTQLLIIDDWGLGGVDPSLGPALLDVIDLQSNNGSLLITSQYPTEKWYEQFNDPTIADAILDRIVHRAHRLQLHGESMRKVKGKDI